MSNTKENHNNKVLQYCSVSFLFTVLLLLITFYMNKLYPFGEKIILWSDLEGQYAPFYMELYDRVTEGKSLIYSWNTGLGMPFLGNFFNYLSSPFMIFVFIFGRENIAEAIALMITLKSACASATFTYYAVKVTGKEKLTMLCAGFGVLYSMCGWFVAYYWNIMWLDALYLFPLVMLGIERILDKKKPTLYITALALTLLTNYYMGYMTCIFAVLWFLVKFFSVKREKGTAVREFLHRGVSFALSSLTAAGASAVALVPTFINLQNSSATQDSFDRGYKLYYSFIDFLGNHLANTTPSFRLQSEKVLPNIYSGILTLVFVLAFFLCKKIKLREKLASGALVVFLYFSMNFTLLDYVWHAFHFPNDIPYRFSFMYTFVLLVLAVRYISVGEKTKLWQYALSILPIGVVIVIVHFFDDWFSTETTVLSAAFLGVYAILLILIRFKKTKEIATVLLFAFMISEIIFSDTTEFVLYNNKNEYGSDISGFTEVYDDIKPTDDFYRTETLFNMDTNNPSVFDYYGISSFTSMGYSNVAHLQNVLGIYSNNLNNFVYWRNTPVYSLMHNLKYTVKKSDMSKTTSFDNCIVDENDYYLPLAFSVNEDVQNWDIESENPFEVQNDWFYRATGISDVFVPLELSNYESKFLKSVKYNTETKKFDFEREENVEFFIENSQKIIVTYKTEKGKHCYSYSQGTDKETLHYIVDREIAEGETIEVEVPISEYYENKDSIFACAYYLDEEKLNEGYEILKQKGAEITAFDETDLTMNVSAGENQVLYTSIPYDKGWTVTVDGKEVEAFTIGGAYIGVDLTEGEHTVEFKFHQRGLAAGAIISVSTLFVLCAYAVISKKRRKTK